MPELKRRKKNEIIKKMISSSKDKAYRDADVEVQKRLAPVKEAIFNMLKESSESTSVQAVDEMSCPPATAPAFAVIMYVRRVVQIQTKTQPNSTVAQSGRAHDR